MANLAWSSTLFYYLMFLLGTQISICVTQLCTTAISCAEYLSTRWGLKTVYTPRMERMALNVWTQQMQIAANHFVMATQELQQFPPPISSTHPHITHKPSWTSNDQPHQALSSASFHVQLTLQAEIILIYRSGCGADMKIQVKAIRRCKCDMTEKCTIYIWFKTICKHKSLRTFWATCLCDLYLCFGALFPAQHHAAAESFINLLLASLATADG